MVDIFDQIAGNTEAASGAPDIFDHIAGNIPAPAEPSLLSKAWSDVKDTPRALRGLLASIPTGASNIFQAATNDIPRAVSDAWTMGKNSIFDTNIPPRGTPQESKESYDRLERTLGGIGSIAATIAGGGTPLGPIGMAAAQTGFDKLNQLTGADVATTPEQDADALRRNTIQGAILSGAAKVAGKGLTGTSEAVKPPTPEDIQIQNLGVSLSDIKRANKFKPTIDGETPLDQAFNGAKERGVFTGDDAPAEIKARNLAAKALIADQLHGENGLLSQADEAIANKKGPEVPKESLGWWKSLDDFVNAKNAATAPDSTPPSPIDYTKAEEYIAKNPDQADALTKQLDKRKAVTDNMFDGTLSSLSKRKSALGQIAYDGTTDSKVLDQKVYQDIKNTIESRANEIVPGLGDKVKELNSQLSEHYTLEPIIERAVNKDIQAGYKDPPPSTLKSLLSTAAAGGVITAPHVAIPAVIGYGVAKGAAAIAKSRPGRSIASSALQKIASASPDLAPVTIAANNTPISSNDLQGLLALSSAKGNQPAILDNAFASLKGKNMDMLMGLPKARVLDAVRSIESGGLKDPIKAVSSTGAVGPYQFMPATAKALGIDPKDSTQARDGAARLLQENFDRFKDPLLAIAAYNWSPGKLSKLLDTHKAASWDEVKNYAPEETQNYIKKFKTLVG